MTWFKVDDNLAFHTKVVQAGNAAMGLWVRAGSWAAQMLTDGFVPDHIVLTMGTKGQARALVAAGLWETVDGGYQLHDYLSYNPTADEVRADQARKHEAKVNAGRAGGVASGVARRKHTRSSDEADAKQNRSKTKPRPDPSRPVPLEDSSGGVSHASSHVPGQLPLFADRCTKHADVEQPGACGGCADVRKANIARPRPLSLVTAHTPAKVPHCGQCDETRHRSTKFGVIRCPECHPLAEEAS